MMTPEEFHREHDQLRFDASGHLERVVRETAEDLVERRAGGAYSGNFYTIPFRMHRGYRDVRVFLPAGADDFEARLLVERQIRSELAALREEAA